MSHDNSDPTTSGLTRRTVLRGAAGTAAAGVALGSAGTTAAQSGENAAYGGWFEGVQNFDGTVDKTGQSEVTVTVGAQGNGGSFAFGPAAVRIDPGTTVTWEWTGAGGSHNVVAEDGSFESELVGESGHTFSHTFESEGTTKYACVPHKPMGMKGAVVVGGGSAAAGGAGGSDGGDGESGFRDGLTLGAGLGLVGVLLTTFVFGSKSETRSGRRSTN